MLRRLGWTLRGWWWYGKSHIPHPPSFKEPLRANKGLCPRPRPVAHAERAAHCARLKRPQKGLSLGGCRGARLETYLFSHAYTGPYRCFVGHAIYLQFLCLRSANKPSPPVRIMCRGRRFMPPNANANLTAHRAENITAKGRVRSRVASFEISTFSTLSMGHASAMNRKCTVLYYARLRPALVYTSHQNNRGKQTHLQQVSIFPVQPKNGSF